jgi:multiple sugar transport system ATP-binding protein
MIYVTHDQIEAMTLADRIVLMREGRIEQQGAPLELFERPASLFVAGFLGSPKMNFLRGRITGLAGRLAVDLGENVPELALPPERRLNGAGEGTPVILGLRPEHVGRARGDRPVEGTARLEATVELVQPTGSRSYASFRLAGQPVLAELQAHDVSGPGERITVDLNLRRAAVFDPETGKAL